MWRMPYVLLRWYALQSAKQYAHEDLRRLDAHVLALVEDPGEVYGDLRTALSYAAQHGMAQPERALSPAEFRMQVEAWMGANITGVTGGAPA